MNFVNAILKKLKTTAFIATFLHTLNLSAHQTIGITQIVDHPSLNEIRNGILEGLALDGFVEGKDFSVVFENAHGNPTTAAQIAQKFAGLKLDVIVPITTPSAQTVIQQTKTIPVIFAAISDPVAAKVVPTSKQNNITGVADVPPIQKQLEFILKCIPDLKTLGVVYNPGETNNVSFLEKLQEAADQHSIALLTTAAPKSSDVQAAARKLATQVDAIFIGNDNTVVSGLEPLIKICLDAKVPLFASDPESVERGALAAYAYDQHAIGRQVGAMVAKILNGTKPNEIPIEEPKSLELTINPETASKLQIKCDAK